MKKLVLSLLFCMAALGVTAADDVMMVYLNDGSFKGFYSECIDSIVFSNYDLSYTWHDELVTQEIWTADSVSRILIDMIDSIAYEMPQPVYRSEVIRMDDSYMKYIESTDGMTVTFAADMPEEMRPKPGDVLLYEGSNESFPHGFAGRVGEEGTTGACDSVDIEDIYERLYFFGSYQIVQANDDEEGYQAQQLRGGNSVRVGDDDKGFFESIADVFEHTRNFHGSANNINCPPIKKKAKLTFKEINTFVAAEVEYTPILSIEVAWDTYAFSETGQYLYYMCRVNETKKTKFTLGYSLDGVEAMEDKYKKSHPEASNPKWWNKEFGSEWFESIAGANTFDGHKKDNGDGSMSMELIDAEVPIPQCPALVAGVKFGFFVKPTIEGEITYSNSNTVTRERTYIYKRTNFKLGTEPDMDKWFDGPATEESAQDVTAKGKIALWAGVEAGVFVGTTGGNLKFELTGRIGPYMEGTLQLDILDAVQDWSWYSLVESTKIRTGIKWGIDASFSAKFLGKMFKGTPLSYEPETLLLEQADYLVPEFSKPFYWVKGNSLIVESKLSRNTVSNVIGFQLVDEEGNKITKFADVRYLSELEYMPNPFRLTFDNLDFGNHHYTIYPITRPFDIASLRAPIYTAVTCIDAHHPHFIDLGLPSGTLWSCCNVCADDPLEEGRYYQWGMPQPSAWYDENHYDMPTLEGTSISGTSYDPATTKYGSDYVMPSRAQFEELLEYCTLTPDNKWFESSRVYETVGAYLDGPNGNCIYMPYAGYMKGDDVVGEAQRKGYYLMGNIFTDGAYLTNHAVVLPERIRTNVDYYGYSVRPVKTSFSVDQTEFAFTHAFSLRQVTVIGNGGWTATVTQGSDWLKVTPTHGSGVSTLTIEASTNYSRDSRTGVITLISDKGYAKPITITVTQDGSDSLFVDQTEFSLTSGFSLRQVNITGYDNWTAAVTQGSDWLKVSPTEGTGKGTLTIEASTNNSTAARTGIIIVTPKFSEPITITVKQEGATPMLSASTSSFDFGAASGSQMLTLTGNDSWTAAVTQGSDWLRISPKQGQGDGSITIDASANTASTSRTGVITITPASAAPITVQVVQEGVKMELSVEVTSLTFDCAASHRVLTITGNDSWTAAVTQGSDWLRISPKQGTGSGSLTIDAYINSSTSSRTGIVTVTPSKADAFTITVLQEGRAPDTKQKVDLGLPSGTLWATCNIGATTPENPGDYFAWGEVKTKDSYYWSSYKWCNGTSTTLNKYCNSSSYGTVDNKLKLTESDDAATVNWGENWRMPTGEELCELYDNCTLTYTTRGGCDGFLATSNVPGYTDRSIFLPVGGYAGGTETKNTWVGFYWLSTLNVSQPQYADCISFDESGFMRENCNYRYGGFNIRPVCDAPATAFKSDVKALDFGGVVIGQSKMLSVVLSSATNGPVTVSLTQNGSSCFKTDFKEATIAGNEPRFVNVTFTPTSNTPQTGTLVFHNVNAAEGERDVTVVLTGVGENVANTVDMGLPSGTLWASWNIGASTPEEYGELFAWGELTSKTTYTWDNYRFGTRYDMTKYVNDSNYGSVDNKTVLEVADDAATQRWGSHWRMPTTTQLLELMRYTTRTWTTVGGKVVCKLTSTNNGQVMYLPAAGIIASAKLQYRDESIYLASTDVYTGRCTDREVILLEKDDTDYYYQYIFRHYGISIRPVYVK